jgi:hypothetical protein
MSPTEANEVTEVTRRAIVDFISTSGKPWAGRLNEDDFLARLYDLTALPSHDPRMANAAGDIYQHRVNWRGDWADDWVFYDWRFNLIRASDETFLRFLCESGSRSNRRSSGRRRTNDPSPGERRDHPLCSRSSTCRSALSGSRGHRARSRSWPTRRA